MNPWLHVVGIGEDGPAGLGPAARALIEGAEVLVGGARHLALIGPTGAETLTWGESFGETLERLLQRRGRRVVVVASGDPMWYGVGATLSRRIDPAEMVVLPVPGAFSLAAARMGWSLADLVTLTVHGRPLESVLLYLQPGERMLILSQDGQTPAALAALLTEKGWGPSRMCVLEHLGGPDERCVEGAAEAWAGDPCADLNTIALECRTGPDARPLSRAPGLPDEAFEHDGQITKREVRALAVSALAPRPGRLLWDVGAGSGSVAIEYLRLEPRAEALCVERDAGRAARIGRNALALGTPRLRIVEGTAPDALADLERRPDVVFVGGGVSRPGVLEACWEALPAGGRLVAHAVTLEAERRLLDWRAAHCGELLRLAVERAEGIGALTAFNPLRAVLHLAVDKP